LLGIKLKIRNTNEEYPIKQIKFMGGPQTNTKSLKQDNWNRNTHIGNRTIPVDRIKLIEIILK